MYYQPTLFDTSEYMSNPETLTKVYCEVLDKLRNLNVDKVQMIATMCGVMCETVLDAAEDIEKVTYEEFSDNPEDQECEAACKCGCA